MKMNQARSWTNMSEFRSESKQHRKHPHTNDWKKWIVKKVKALQHNQSIDGYGLWNDWHNEWANHCPTNYLQNGAHSKNNISEVHHRQPRQIYHKSQQRPHWQQQTTKTQFTANTQFANTTGVPRSTSENNFTVRPNWQQRNACVSDTSRKTRLTATAKKA